MSIGCSRVSEPTWFVGDNGSMNRHFLTSQQWAYYWFASSPNNVRKLLLSVWMHLLFESIWLFGGFKYFQVLFFQPYLSQLKFMILKPSNLQPDPFRDAAIAQRPWFWTRRWRVNGLWRSCGGVDAGEVVLPINWNSILKWSYLSTVGYLQSITKP